MAPCDLPIRPLWYWFLRARVEPRALRGSVRVILSLAVVTWLLCCPVWVNATNVILLKNGDRVSGDILTMEDTVLSIDTDYADVIKIDWDDVSGLTSAKPLWVSFHDGTLIPEHVGVRDGDRLILFRLEPGGPIQLDTIKTINLFELSYWGSLGLGGSATSGNTSTETINASGTLTVNKGWHRFILDGRANRGKAEGKSTRKMRR